MLFLPYKYAVKWKHILSIFLSDGEEPGFGSEYDITQSPAADGDISFPLCMLLF